jgi:hypothetical protein
VPDAGQSFRAKVQEGPGSKVYIPLPFDPSAVWGQKTRHHITGTINGHNFRGPIENHGGGFALAPGPAWRRDSGIGLGDDVIVVLRPEGPQPDALTEDLTQALDAEPAARDFFDSLATFYRKAYLTWIDGTKRRPEERARRIQQLVELLKAGRKQRD